MKNLIATSAAALVLSAGIASAAPPWSRSASPFEFPVNVISADQGSFVGSFKIERFAVHQGRLVASGSLVGTLLDENGLATAVYRTTHIPVNLPTLSRGRRRARPSRPRGRTSCTSSWARSTWTCSAWW